MQTTENANDGNLGVYDFPISGFEFVSDFDIRISDFTPRYSDFGFSQRSRNWKIDRLLTNRSH